MTLTVAEVLQLECMRSIAAVAGREGLHRRVRWVHLWPEVIPSFRGGELLLTTGHSWPPDPGEQRRIVRELEALGIAAILFATGRYFPNIPQAILEAADACGLPILEARTDVAFVDITEALNREILRRQYETIERSEQIHRTLTASALQAQRLQDIAEALSSLIGRPVAITDSEGRLLARSPAGGHDPGAQLHGVVCPIQVGQETVGHLWVLEEDKPLSDLDVRAAEHGAVVAGLHILRQKAVATVEARVRHSFVEALLWGDFQDGSALHERARLLGFDPEGAHAVGIAALLRPGSPVRKRALEDREEFSLRERLGGAIHAGLEARGVRPFLAFSLNQVVFLLPADRRGKALPAQANRDVRQLAQAVWQHLLRSLPGCPLAVAVGGTHDGARGVSRSYLEADRALAISRGPGLFFYDDLLVLRVLDAVEDRRVLAELVERTFLPLRSAGPSYETLKETVRTLASHSFRQREAARALNVHWNTLRHRIERLEHLWGRSLEDAELRLQISLACLAEQVLELE